MAISQSFERLRRCDVELSARTRADDRAAVSRAMLSALDELGRAAVELRQQVEMGCYGPAANGFP